MRTICLCLVALVGCIDEFTGSNVQFDFNRNTPVEAPVGLAPTGTQLPANVHFSLYALSSNDTTGFMFKLQDFEIHKVVDLTSPCFIDVGEHVPHPGLHVSQYASVIEQDTGIPDPRNPPPGASKDDQIAAATALQRQENVAMLYDDATGLKVVSGASTATYPAVAADCTATDGIPPAMCTDEASNKRRLDMCQAFWKANPEYFEGTDRVLTSPLNGTTHGMVDGANPVNSGALVGGAQFFVDEALANFDRFAIYLQYDDADGDGVPDYPPGFPDSQKAEAGQLYLYGSVTTPTRDVMHVHLKSPDSNSTVAAEMVIFPDLGQDTTNF